MPRQSDTLGTKLGPRIAALVHQANTAAAQGKLHLHHKLGMQLQHDFFKLTGSEIQATLGPLFRTIATHDDTPEHLRDTFAFLADGLGQWQTFLATQVGGSVLGTGLGALLANELAPVVGRLIEDNPNGFLPISTSAQLAARGLLPVDTAATEAKRQGMSGGRFADLVRASQSDLEASQILELVNRGELAEDTAHIWLARAGMSAASAEALMNLRHAVLPPAMLADAVVRGILPQDHAATAAAASGLDATQFDLLVRDTGEAPALQTLLEAFRRGIIDRPRLEHGIRTGRLRNEWIDVAEALRYQPPSPSEAIAGAVQGHLSTAEAQHKAMEAGLNPAEFDWLFQTHGEPIAVGQALSLWNRGVVAQGVVEQVIRESRTKTKYIPAILALRRHLLPERTVVSMVGKGALTKAQGVRHLLDLGVDSADAAALIGEASNTKTAHHRALSEATVLELWTDAAISEADARAHLLALGYDDAEATMVLRLHQLRTGRRLQQAAVNVIRSRFVSRHIDDTAATAALDAAQVSSSERDMLLALWGLERDTTTRLPTVAELTRAYKAGVLDGPTWAARLQGMGYGQADVPIMAAAHGVTLGG